MCVSLVWVTGTISLLTLPLATADSDYSLSEIRELVRSGEILPLESILQRHRMGGRLLDLEVEREHGRMIYELEMLREDGHVVEIEVDARSGEMLKESYD